MNLGLIKSRVEKWNSERYTREYNHELSVKLLKEELSEWFDAETAVDKVDALCDIVYVAFGVIWKVNVDELTLNLSVEQAYNQLCSKEKPIAIIEKTIAKYDNDNDYPVTTAMDVIILAALAELHNMGLTTDEVFEVLNIVCDSNDSKSVKKVESHVKANDGDKGSNFIAPEPRLLQVLTKVELRHGN